MTPDRSLLAPVLPGDDVGRRRLSRRQLRVGDRHRDRVDGGYPPLSDFDGSGRAVLDPDDAADDIEALIFGDELHGEIAGLDGDKSGATHPIARDDFLRSEEHTSELQSLMRISYAVFCL